MQLSRPMQLKEGRSPKQAVARYLAENDGIKPETHHRRESIGKSVKQSGQVQAAP